ncbi:hypothetical protein [Cylindrospermopsis raciborskii]|uniref:Uncharacterized protein n=1 Tax=Cylindrospermopsis raciborskii CENA302 TaxID=1170768 RepID=A0A9Q5WAW2_9CYAN|nr:hypothetical protein [Cylindrospermopsis raciborskii]NLQ04109.1 hypothetical protein [Cylindrospermopsis raciborskii MVCC19]OHY31711.1 hypothetical protein BCV64_14455 [Cylindrospermopsis raciborskii MVCC14]OPH10934.1 hypothetical protein CENA302_02200 [Cylindrospermopsis raciborskii CENA302]
MNKYFLRGELLLVCGAGIAFIGLFAPQPSFSNTASTSQPLNSPDNTNPLANDSGLDMFNIIHRLNFGPLNWDPNQQNQQLEDAAAAFKARQNQILQNQQPSKVKGEENRSGANTDGSNTERK